MQRSSFGGHEIERLGDDWVYKDTKEKIIPGNPDRPCKKCGKEFKTIDGVEVDPCLGLLPGVDNACCGHGKPSESYIMFSNGITIRGFCFNK